MEISTIAGTILTVIGILFDQSKEDISLSNDNKKKIATNRKYVLVGIIFFILSFISIMFLSLLLLWTSIILTILIIIMLIIKTNKISLKIGPIFLMFISQFFTIIIFNYSLTELGCLRLIKLQNSIDKALFFSQLFKLFEGKQLISFCYIVLIIVVIYISTKFLYNSNLLVNSFILFIFKKKEVHQIVSPDYKVGAHNCYISLVLFLFCLLMGDFVK